MATTVIEQSTFLKAKNRVYSKLAAAITAGATSLTVTLADAGLFPDTYPFHLTIDDEIVSVTNRVSNTLTIVRAQQDTTAATHANKSYVALNITAKAVSDLNAAVNTIEQALQSGINNIIINGTADYPLNLLGATVNSGGADIQLSNAAKIDNTVAGTLKLMTTASGYVSISEGQIIAKCDYLDLDLDVALRFIGSGKNIDGHLVFRDDLDLGRSGAPITIQVYGGTTDIRGTVIMEGTVRVDTANGIDINPQSDIDADLLTVGVTGTPKLWWDESEDQFAFNKGLLLSTNEARHIEITGAATSAQIYIGGTAILASGEQAIYINAPSETVATNGIWITLGSTVTSGDLSGIRSRVTGNAASAGANVRGAYLEAKAGASKFVAMLEGVLSHADYSAGSVTVSGDVRGFTAHISQGSGLNAANLYGGLINIQTRGDETITTDDVGLMIRNEAVGGNGRTMDAAIKIAGLNMGGGVSPFTYDIIFQNGSTLTDDGTSLTLAGANLVSTLGATTLAGTVSGGGQVVNNLGKTYIGDTSNARMVKGLTIQQDDASDEIIAFKSSTVNQPWLAVAEADTFGAIRKADVNAGGMMLFGFRDSSGLNYEAFGFYGCLAEDTRTGKSTSEHGIVDFYATQLSGNALADIVANGNAFCLIVRRSSAWATVFILDEDGDLWLDGNITSNAFSVATDGTVTTLSTISGDYFRIGDAGTTSHSLASEDDLMVTGKLEVTGLGYFDSDLLIADTKGIFTGTSVAGYLVVSAYNTNDAARIEAFRISNTAVASGLAIMEVTADFYLIEKAAAGPDIAGRGQFWVKDATPNTPYFTDDAGTDHAIITGGTATKHEFHVPFEDPTGAVGNWDVVEINATQDTHFVFQVPEGFESLVNAKIVMIPDATETIQWDINVSVSAAGEAQDNDTRSAVDQTLAVTADQLTEVDISGQLSGLVAGDYVAIDFLSDTGNLRIIGFEFDYL